MIRFRSSLNLSLLAIGLLITALGYLFVGAGLDLPVRWGLDLQPTQTMPRNLALLQMPIAVAVVWGLLWAVQRFGATERQPSKVRTLNWTLSGVTALLVAVQGLIVVIGLRLS